MLCDRQERRRETMSSVKSLLNGRRVGVVLSSGYFGFYGHAGFSPNTMSEGLRALEAGKASALAGLEQEPQSWSGAD